MNTINGQLNLDESGSNECDHDKSNESDEV